jgi:lactococcin 972-like bacteriocin
MSTGIASTAGCWSNYVHPNNYRSSTAFIGNKIDKRYASAGSWSLAYAEAGLAFTCYTYYDPRPDSALTRWGRSR